MRYLFFDIECADGSKAICEFGYVLTNEKFRVIQKRNILINPECKFNLTGRVGQEDLLLSYPYNEYYKHQPFDEVYDEIKYLMCQKDLMIFGHAVKNDIGFLFKDCNRYGLKLFDFKSHDVQMMLPVFSKKNRRFAKLDVAFDKLAPADIKEGLKNHRACDDAFKTMIVFKMMVVDLEFTPNELIDSCPNCVYDSLEYWKQRKEERKLRKQKEKRVAKRKKGEKVWADLCNKHRPLLEKQESIGKLVTVNGEMKEHLKELEELITIIKGKGYVAYKGINGSDILVAYNEDDKKTTQEGLKYPYSGKLVTYDEFINTSKTSGRT